MKVIKKATKQDIQEIKKLLLEHYPDSVTELNYDNLYQLLVSVILSAQCTDRRVNIITPTLFQKYPNIIALASANLEEIKELIKSCSFFNNKANNLIKMAKQVVDDYDSNIPLDKNELVKLAGVGQKTANVVMIEYAGANLMAVDTHVFRVSHRLGLSNASTATKTEKDLTDIFKIDLHRLHQAMVLFGRYRCKAINPLCKGCFLLNQCKSRERFKI